ncbi:MAG TPA: hypothetical protein VK727_22660 [Steroidobacteraceae bacterium]|nr:hypothetical protein [Steroidobacteraceae bacterium]
MRPIVHIRRTVIVACLAAAVAAATHAEDSSSVQAKWDAITRCAPLVDDGARHACLDDVLRKSGLMPNAARAAAPTAAIAAPVAAAPAAAAPTAAAATPSAKPAPEDPIQVTLAGVKRGADGTLLLNTTEGAVWRQIEPAALHPDPVAGDTLTIKRTVFGGYMCQSKKWIEFRCVRTR